MKTRYILEDCLIILLLIAMSAGFFFAIFNIVADRVEQRERDQDEQEQVRAGHMLRHEIRMSGIYGMNLNFNPEI